MNKHWKQDFLKAIILFAVIAVVAIFLNWLRTPVLFAMSDQGNISRAKAHRMEGVRLIDNWTHAGWPDVTRQDTPAEPDENDNGETPAEEPENLEMTEIIEVDLETAKQYFDEGEIIFLDAREPDAYEQGHILGALDWPYNDFESFQRLYRDLVTKDTPVLCYCNSETCDESFILAESLMYEYYQEIYLFRGGIEEWEAWGYPTKVGGEP